MKYAIIPFVALGLILSLTMGIRYRCEGAEAFPVFYGSPFVFKRQSLASSMEYFYSISGLIMNVAVWSVLLFIIHKVILVVIYRLSNPKWMHMFYKVFVGVLIAFASFAIAIESTMIGRGYDKQLNYWYWNIDQEAKDWGMSCKGKIFIFRNTD